MLGSRIERFLAEQGPDTPCLVVVLDVVVAKYRELVDALPDASVYYAVKANPSPALLRALADVGACFDAASPHEIELCLRAGVARERISYGNTIKKEAHIAHAHSRGIRLFAFDSLAELEKLAEAAPGAQVFCRLLSTGGGADWPLSRKFGCTADMAFDLLRMAATMGLRPYGVSFHVGSQQRDPSQWVRPIAEVAALYGRLAEAGIPMRMINLGGGFPARYSDDVPPVEAYACAIHHALQASFGAQQPAVFVEPGRYISGDAGVLVTEVVLISRKSYEDEGRWVFLDAGVFNGLAETLGEAIKYRIRAPGRDQGPDGPVVIAGPTCDSVDIMYERSGYRLPLDLKVGDRLHILSAGAYTATYSSVGFNGFPPLRTYCI